MTKTMMTAFVDGEEMEMDFGSYAAMWGCDPCYDHKPRLPGDGYLFYNFAVEGKDRAFLAKFLPAIKRTILQVLKRTVKTNPKESADYETEDERQRDIEELTELKMEVKRRLKNAK